MIGLKSEIKDRALLILRSKVNDSIEIFNYHFAYHETKADAIRIYLLLLILIGAK